MQEQSTTVEEWRTIPGLDGLYQASSIGRIRSLKNSRGRPCGTPRILKQCRATGGAVKYCTVSPSVNGKQCSMSVHVLVLLSFSGPRPPGFDACHLDGNSANNNLSNLKWGSRSENMGHSRLHGTMAMGERQGSAKLTNEQVLEIARRCGTSEYYKHIAADYAICRENVTRIALGKSWGWLTGNDERMRRR